MSFPLAHRVASFGTTIFAEMSRLAVEHGAINLGQGFPDFDGPDPVKEAAIAAIRAGDNQYAVGIGQPALRRAIAAHAVRFYGQQYDPDSEVTVTSGATEALFAATLGLVDPGDEVIFFEPFYDSYLPNVIMAGGVPRFVPLRAPRSAAEGWHFDPDELAVAFNHRTRLVVINTPHNPTGKVYSEAELRIIADLCQRWNVIALTDEVYEHIVFDGARHMRLAQLPGMAERTLIVSSQGKTFSFTGWKIGWVLASPDLTLAVRRAHQWITYATATPLQAATVAALALDDEYYQSLVTNYQTKRDFLAGALQQAGLRVSLPQGTYFIMADFSPLGYDDDVAFCRWLTTEVGVAAIPPTAFYSDEHKHLGRTWARFAFCKRLETLEKAAERLRRPLSPA
ncbi:MAG: methionine aminotransferase [Anaerolineales bacterium]